MVEEKEEQKVEEKVAEKKVNYVIPLVIFSVVVIGILFYIFTTAEEGTNIRNIFGIVLILVILGGVGYGVFYYRNKWKSLLAIKGANGIPEPATPEEVESHVKNFILNKKHNHIKQIQESRPYHVNKQLIYAMKIELLYPEKIDNKQNNVIYMIVNCNYLKVIPPAIVNGTFPWAYIKQVVNTASSSPEDDPDVEERVDEDPITGRKSHVKKTIHSGKKNKETKKQEAELA